MSITQFKKLCYKTQPEVKSYMENYLKSKQYKVINEDGFLYAKGDVPVLLVAHMDTVHKQTCVDIITSNERMYSPQGIGGDDRCGVYIITQIVNKMHCSVLLCEDEETGGVGANKFAKTEYIKNLDVNYMIEFDRHGNNDAVFYSCGNEDFISFACDNTGYKRTWGTFSDISVLMPASKLCAVNLSSGYYCEHTTSEYVVYEDMMATIEAGIALIKAECETPFEYKARTYSYDYYDDDDEYDYNKNPYGNTSAATRDIAELARKDTMVELEVCVADVYGQMKTLWGKGQTKAECWLDVFTNHPNVCFNDIVDYVFV